MSALSANFYRANMALLCATLVGCSRERPVASADSKEQPLRVRVVVVQREVAPAILEITGTVRPLERALIAAKIAGTVDSLPLTLGQTVRRGDLLVRLTAPEFGARLTQARAQLAQAQREDKRARDLAAAGADTADAAHAAAERLQAARAAMEEATAMLAYTEIRAPYDGRVARKYAYPGDLATPGSPLLALENLSAFQVETAVPVSVATHVKLGDALPVHVAGASDAMTGTVAEIAGAADPATHTLEMKLALPAAAAALSGRTAQIEFAGLPSAGLFVPAGAVTRFGQMERVFVVVAGRAQLRLVQTGATRGGRVELLAGVAAGESVIVSPPTALRDGQGVQTAP